MYLKIKKCINKDYDSLIKKIEVIKGASVLTTDMFDNNKYMDLIKELYAIELEETDYQILVKKRLNSLNIKLGVLKLKDIKEVIIYYSLDKPVDLDKVYSIEEVNELIENKQIVLHTVLQEGMLFNVIALSDININNLGIYESEIIELLKLTLKNRNTDVLLSVNDCEKQSLKLVRKF